MTKCKKKGHFDLSLLYSRSQKLFCNLRKKSPLKSAKVVLESHLRLKIKN